MAIGSITAALYRQYHADILKFVSAKLGNEANAEDIVQDIFIKIHLHHHTITDESKIKSWIYTVARNTVNDYFRKSKNPASEVEDIICEEEQTVLENHSFEKCLSHFIPRLPQKYSDIIIKTVWGNFSQAAYAKHKNISNSGAKSLMQRAPQKLLKQYRECCHYTADVYGNIIESDCTHPCHS